MSNNIITLKSAAAGNLEQLVQAADSTGQLAFYDGTVESCKANNFLLMGEYERLKDLIRAKRLKIAEAEKKAAEDVKGPGLHCFAPEMGEQRPNCQIVAMRSYYGKHYHIYTPLQLKGRGVELVGLVSAMTAQKLFHMENNCVEYLVTARAFEKLQKEYSISMECCLD